MIDKDPALRAIVGAMRRANNKGSSADDQQRVLLLAGGYKPSRRPIDTSTAIEELLDFGSADEPREVSIELRYALARHLSGHIRKKTGPKTAPDSALLAFFAAHNARLFHSRGMPMVKAIAKAALSSGVSKSAISALVYPRKSRRKT